MLEIVASLLLACSSQTCVWEYHPHTVTVTMCAEQIAPHKETVYTMPGMKTLIVYTTPCRSA